MSRRELVALATSTEDRAHLIDGTVWADGLTWDEIEVMARYVKAFAAEPGVELFAEGDRAGRLWIVAKGLVNIEKTDSERRRKVIATVGPGRTLGEMSLVDGEPASASAVAATDVTVLMLMRSSFEEMIHKPPHLGVKLLQKIARLLSQRLRQTSGALIDLL